MNILHPMLVHFPIALTLAGFLLEVIAIFRRNDICVNKTALILLLLGTLGAIAASVSGALTPNLTGEEARIEGIHHVFALLTTTFLCLASLVYLYIWRTGKTYGQRLNWIGFSLYGLAALSVSATGYFGGYIVYNLML